MLLTNDGELETPARTSGQCWDQAISRQGVRQADPEVLAKLKDGVTIDNVKYGSIDAVIDKLQGDNAWLTLPSAKGKNREVKKVCEHLGLRVNRLIRVAFGPFQLGDLVRGGLEKCRQGAARPARREGRGGTRACESSAESSKAIVSQSPSGQSTRPTSDRVREAIFNILALAR